MSVLVNMVPVTAEEQQALAERVQCEAHVGFRWDSTSDWQERYYRHAQQCMRWATGKFERWDVCTQHRKQAEHYGVLP